MRAAIFLDKDGTLLVDVPYNADPEQMRLAPGAAEGLKLLASTGLPLVVVSNQSGVARGYFPEAALAVVSQRLAALLADCGARLAGFYHCPHHPDGSVAAYARSCDCRKPQPGMLLAATRDLGLDPGRSWMVGDILDDIEAGRRAGCRTVLLAVGNETEWQLNPWRWPDFLAKNLEGAARCIVSHLEKRHAC